MDLTDNEQKIVDFVKNDKILSKHIAKNGYLSGCTTFVAPITIWKNKIIVLLENGRKATPYTLRGVCSRIKQELHNEVDDVYVDDYYDSIPRELTIWMK